MGYRAKTLRVVSVNDDAIDTERMPLDTMRKYLETRDEALIKPFIKAGQQPTWFTIGEIPHAMWGSFLETAANNSEQQKRAFRCAVTLVENLYQSDGVFVPSWEPPRDANGIMRDEAFARIAPSEWSEIGSIAYAHGFFPLKTRVLFQLPPMSLAALVARTFLPADANPSSQAQSSETASSASEAATPSPQSATASSSAT